MPITHITHDACHISREVRKPLRYSIYHTWSLNGIHAHLSVAYVLYVCVEIVGNHHHQREESVESKNSSTSLMTT